MHYLRAVASVGLITVFTFYTEIINIHRFPTLDHMIAFIGLIPSIRASDEKEHILELMKRCNKYLRYLLIEAVWVVVRKGPALTMAYSRLLKDKKSQQAIIRIIKKLVSRLKYVWVHQTNYVLAVVA